MARIAHIASATSEDRKESLVIDRSACSGSRTSAGMPAEAAAMEVDRADCPLSSPGSPTPNPEACDGFGPTP
ncbi:hypothetical protein ADK67_27970 [Saccharothrix sp. NRRL B-16348]|nr:hypothetical protein ADK67_27970 [Saccharothrix sp. NRRL B-16348]